MTERRILDGVRVLDFTHVVAGPYCTRVLADLGAEVVKVDPPPSAGAEEARTTGSVANNVGKRSIVLDLKTPAGLKVALELAARADVLVENFTPGVMATLGLGYEDVAHGNPAIVYASISGFGQTGPLSHRRAYGAVAHAESGWLWVQQQAQGGSEPFAPGVTVADIVTAMNAVSAILAALYDRERTGEGQWIDVTLAESQMAMLSEVARPALEGAPQEAWRPFRHPIHRARDGHVTINLGSERNWQRIARALGHAGTPRPPAADDANALVGSWVAQLTVDDVARGMEATGAPFGVVRSIHEAFRDPYWRQRGMVQEVSDPVDKIVRVTGSPLHFSRAASGPGPAGAPLAGQHSAQILAELGYQPQEIDALLASGAVLQQTPSHRGPT